MIDNDYPEWIKKAAAECYANPGFRQNMETAIARAYQESVPRPIKEDFAELTNAFARMLFQWQHPEGLAPTVPIALHGEILRQYFWDDVHAHRVLDALVMTAMRNRERWGWSEQKRQAEDARQLMMTAQALKNCGITL